MANRWQRAGGRGSRDRNLKAVGGFKGALWASFGWARPWGKGGIGVVEIHTSAHAPRLHSLIARAANGLVQRTLGVRTVLIGYIGVR